MKCWHCNTELIWGGDHDNDYGHKVEILGPSKVVYSPDKPLSCGARVWIETEAEVKIA